MTINIAGLSNLIKAFEKANVELPVYVHNAMVNSVNYIRNQEISIVPVDTGSLKNSISVEVSDTPPTGKVMVGQPYGIYVEYGTGIYATKGGGRQTPWVYRRADGSFVRTSGNKPQPFVGPSFSASKAYVNDQFKRATLALIKSLK